MAQKLSLYQRKRAVVLLQKGMTAKDASAILQRRYYPDRPVDEVQKRFFPRGGFFALSYLEGKPRAEIKESFQRMVAAAQKQAEMMRLRHQDPIYAARQRQILIKYRNQPEVAAKRERALAELWKNPKFRSRASARMRVRHKDSVFRAASIERLLRSQKEPGFIARKSARSRAAMIKLRQDPVITAKRDANWRKIMEDPAYAALNAERARQLSNEPAIREARAKRLRITRQDPEFTKKQLGGIKAFWNEYRRKRTAIWLYDQKYAWEGRNRVPLAVENAEEEVDRNALHKEIIAALEKIPSINRAVVSYIYGLELETDKKMAEMIFGFGPKKLKTFLDEAYEELRKNKRLARLAEIYR